MRKFLAALMLAVLALPMGNVNAARNFVAASDDNLNAGNPSALDITGDTITVAAWVKLTTSQKQKFVSKWQDAGSQFSYLLEQNGGGDVARFVRHSGSGAIAEGTTTLVTGVWFHLVGTYDGTNVRIYVNGVEEDSTAATGNIDSSTAPVRIGSGSGVGEDPADGDIGHAAIWDIALTAAEVASLHAGISPLKMRRANLLFYPPVNGQSPEADVVGGLDLTISGTTVVEEPPISNPIVAP